MLQCHMLLDWSVPTKVTVLHPSLGEEPRTLPHVVSIAIVGDLKIDIPSTKIIPGTRLSILNNVVRLILLQLASWSLLCRWAPHGNLCDLNIPSCYN